MGVHDGHRKRLIRRFLEEELDNFNPHNILELLLFYGIPRRDTNVIAHTLLDHFGSLSGVMDAPFAELVAIEGVGEHAASLIKLIPQLARAYSSDKSNDIVLNSTEKAGQYLLSRYIGRNEEVVYMVCIDSKCRITGTALIHRGSVNAAEVNIRKIMSTALKYNAVGVVIAHNHPGGVALPSSADLVTTHRIREMLAPVNIQLVDHIIIADNDFVSLADTGSI